MTAYKSYHCTACHHEWQETEEIPCDWCGARPYILAEIDCDGAKAPFWLLDAGEDRYQAPLENHLYMEACERGVLDV